jgi:RNA polymerase sigma-B factor
MQVVSQRSHYRPVRASRSHAVQARAREDRRLFLRFHRNGDIAAREELAARFMPLARQVARRYRRPGQPLEDLVQVAALGLVKAIDRYDPDRGTAFSSYAVPTMSGEIRRHFRDSGWALHVPRSMQDLVMRVNDSMARLSRTLGHAPTAMEVGADLGQEPELIVEALEAARAHDAMSLDMPRTSGEEDAGTYADTVGAPDEQYELLEYTSAIAGTFRALPERDRVVLKLRFEEDLTQSQIAARVGVSQMHVSRIIRRALDRLRVAAEAG